MAGWDLAALVRTYREVTERARRDHVPALVHVTDMTQPLGHSSSGSHERYKSPSRLAWETQHDPIRVFRALLIRAGVATESQLRDMEADAKAVVERERQAAWIDAKTPIREARLDALTLAREAAAAHPDAGINDLVFALERESDVAASGSEAIVRRSRIAYAAALTRLR